MAVACHSHAELLAGDFLVIDAEPVAKASELRLIGRLLKDDEDQEGEKPEREGETDDAADLGDPLQHHDQQRGGDRVNREILPVGDRVGHELAFRPDRRQVQGTERYKDETLGTSAA